MPLIIVAKRLNSSMLTTRKYSIAQLEPYIDWSYFLHAWQMPVKYASLGHLHQCQACRTQWLNALEPHERGAAMEAMHLVDDARQMLAVLGMESAKPAPQIEIKGRVGLFSANSENEDIILTTPQHKEIRIPCLRQQHCNPDKPNLCLADFIRPKEHGIADTIGVFATTANYDYDTIYADDPYKRMLAETLCDRLAEAAACLLHAEVRKTIWGYAPHEELTIEDLLRERNQGIRPAVGYPSLPDQSLNFIFEPLIGMREINIALTNNGAMKPHSSVCGLMISHSKATYFTVGKIDNNQLEDYARRRQLPLERVRQFLSANLS